MTDPDPGQPPPETPDTPEPARQAPGWYLDPSGRFVSRYHDGTAWTPTVRDRSGWTGPEWLAPSHPPRPAPASPAETGVVFGLMTVLIGLGMLALSYFALDWFRLPGVSFTFNDLHDLVSLSGGPETFSQVYFAYLGWIAGGVCAVSVILAALPRTGSPALRWLAVLLTAGAAALHVFVAIDLLGDLDDPDIEFLGIGFWLGIAGYGLIIVGIAVQSVSSRQRWP